jgi:hypothetical protein
MMAMKLNPDSVLGLAGIGPKSMQAIEAALANVTFPEPEPVVAPAAEVVAVEGAPAEAAVVPAPAEGVTEGAPAEGVVEAAPAEGQPIATAEVTGEEKPLEEIFSLKPEMLGPIAVAPEEETEEGDDKKKGKKKKKKVVEIVYDPDRDQTIAKKKHKRGDTGVWEEE